MSSPLTSLSSLDESDEPGLSLPFHDPEDIKVAQVNILTFQSITSSNILYLTTAVMQPSQFEEICCGSFVYINDQWLYQEDSGQWGTD
jgi:hypothetical protein